jgi:Protein of unknown function (DUF3309)
MSPAWVLVVILLVVLVAGTPYVGLHRYGYWPSGLLGVVLVVVLVLLLLGYL